MSVLRSEVNPQDSWNVEALYSNMAEWEKEFKRIQGQPSTSNGGRWPQITVFKGRLGEGSATLKKALDGMLELDRQLSKLYTYAHLRHDEDITNDAHKSAFIRATSLYQDFGQEVSWFDPELLSLNDTLLKSYLADSHLADYAFHLQKIVRLKEHTLTSDNEKLLALSAKALGASQKAFSAINDADFQFGSVEDGKGQKKELTHGLYGLYIRSEDRTLRKNAFEQLHGKFREYQNTLAELLSGEVNKHLFYAKARKYPSCLEAALFPNNIDVSVYHSLIQAVRSHLPVLHRYMKLRKQVLEVKELHLYDVYVPLVPQMDMKLPYNEAEQLVIESVAPLGEDYQKKLQQGFQKDRWVDRFENKNKRSGAYSSGCYDSMPYILMNYKDQLRDTFTLAHEAGHSMHSLLSKENQPYHYSSYSIFLAEVASTFNEKLLMTTLLSKNPTREQKIYLINQQIEDIRTTLFRQTLFAEFELKIHQLAEQEVPLTPQLLKEEFRQLNQAYFGPDVVMDDEIEVEWARIPHFYYNFYVYQYATGISAALTLAEKVLKGGEKEKEAYLNFLKGGCSRYPLDILKSAGADMSSPEPVQTAIGSFGDLVDELDQLLVAKPVKKMGKLDKEKPEGLELQQPRAQP